MMQQDTSSEHKPRPLIDLLVSVIIPSIILMKLSGEEHLGPTYGLIIALAFPVIWGLYEFITYRKFNFIALLGFISVLLTGGIGLLKLDPQWLAIKEAAIPLIIGIAVLVSTRTAYPLVQTFIFSPKVFDVERIHTKLDKANTRPEFEKRLMNANYLLAGTFLFSAIMNYVLAKWIVKSPAGTEAFNQEVGQMMWMSYPAIAIPSMIMMLGIVYYLWKTIHRLSGLKLEEAMLVADKEKAPTKEELK